MFTQPCSVYARGQRNFPINADGAMG